MSKMPDAMCQYIYNEAHEAGMKAVEEQERNNQVAMMGVVERENPLDDSSPVVRNYGVFPVCGFAWVQIKPGNSSFARWMKAKQYAMSDSYEGGVRMSVFLFNQSVSKKETYAYAFADVLKKYGIRAYGASRLD